jgi:hypothetical protein
MVMSCNAINILTAKAERLLDRWKLCYGFVKTGESLIQVLTHVSQCSVSDAVYQDFGMQKHIVVLTVSPYQNMQLLKYPAMI